MSNKTILERAKNVDRLDRIMGPLEVALYYSNSDVLISMGAILSTAEIAFSKVPFMINYIRETKDYMALATILPKEIVANMFKIGGIIDIFPTYTWYVNKSQ